MFVLLEVTSLQHFKENLRGAFVALCFFLRLKQLDLQCFELIFPILIDSLRQLLHLQLVLHLCLGPASLRSWLEQMCRASI